MAKYDVEKLLGDLLSIAKAKLNAKLAAIDAEKADGVTMREIDDDAYFFQDLHKEYAAMKDAFCVYMLDGMEADGIGPHTIEKPDIYFVIAVRDTMEHIVPQTQDIRLLRYQRAMKEIFEEGFSINRGGCKLLISGLSPTRFSLNDAHVFSAVGVRIRTALA